MDHKKAANILIRMLEGPDLTFDQREAVQAAVGVLSWTSLAQSRIRNKKTKLQKL